MARTYTSTRRAQQAAQTRADVIGAAIEVFTAEGWAGATVAAIAARAGVAPETVYKGFGSKKHLVRAAMEAAVVGDTAPVPFVERSEFATLADGTLEERCAAAASMVAAIHERSARVWRALAEAASADEEVAGWRAELEQGRLLDTARSLDRVLGTEPGRELTRLIWVLLGPETYLKLVDDAGFDRAAYEAFAVDAFARLLPSPPKA